MDTNTLVESQIAEGSHLLTLLAGRGIRFDAAFWAKRDEEDPWSLYLTTAAGKQEDRAVIRNAVQDALREMPGSWITGMDIHVVEPTNRMAKEILDYYRIHPVRVTTRYRRPYGNGSSIEDAILYPPLSPTSGSRLGPKDAAARMLELMQRQGAILPSTVRLRTGSSFQGLPIGIELDGESSMALQFVDVTTNRPRRVSAEEVVAID